MSELTLATLRRVESGPSLAQGANSSSGQNLLLDIPVPILYGITKRLNLRSQSLLVQSLVRTSRSPGSSFLTA
ncbi:hypothetical protein WJX77_000020 [Trebouxia sp. C0004]